MTVQLIVNADDFGASADVNAAVVEARQRGILTSASLMVTGENAAEAVDIARHDPELAVGLHLTISNGRSLRPAAEIPLLVDGDGNFCDSPARAGARYYFNGRSMRQLRREIEAQFQAFARTGLRLSHVDGHQHLHLHPTVLPIVVELAVRYGACGMRVPSEPFWRSLQLDRADVTRRAVVAAGHAYLRAGCRRLLARSGLVSCDRAVGAFTSGRMRAGYAIDLLSGLRCRSVEIFLHPSIADSHSTDGPNRGDLGTLLDWRLRRFVEDSGFELTNYEGLRERVDACGVG